MLKKIGLAVAGLFVVLLIAIATRPNTYRVERQATIAAPPDTVYALLTDFHRGGEWSPWEKKDPNLKKTYTGKSGEVGSGYAWDGNADVGSGSATITSANAPHHAGLKLEFKRPMEGTADSAYDLTSTDGKSTTVTWSMTGDMNFFSKAFSLFCNMDTMIGGDFETGLASLKTLAEADAKKTPAIAPAGLK
jgi:hypothetical protein